MTTGTVIASSPQRHDASSGWLVKAAKPLPKRVTLVPPTLVPPVGCMPLAQAWSKRWAQWRVESAESARVKVVGCV